MQQPVSNPMGDGQMDLVVTITGEVMGNGRVMVVDNLANEFEVDASMRPKGSGAPSPGEQWLANRRMGFWTLSVMLGATAPPRITGDREGMDSTVAQILDVLAQHGLVIDETLNKPGSVYLDDENDPVGETTDIAPWLVEEDDADEPTPQDEGVSPYSPPVSSDPAPEDVEADEEKDGGKSPEFLNPPKEPTKKYSHVTVVAYNQIKSMGPARAKKDLRRLMRTRADVILLQEVWPNSRDAVFQEIRDDGDWGVARLGTKTDAIMWRKETMRNVDEGYVVLSESDGAGSGRPERSYMWARLVHRESNVEATYISVHMENSAAFAGFYSKDPSDARHVQRMKEQLNAFPGQVRDRYMKKGPVVAGGDWNINYRQDIRLKYPEMLYARMRAIGMRASYEVLGEPSRGSRKSGSLLDQIYHWAPLKNHFKPVWQAILLGYYSDHRPVMVTYRIKNTTKTGSRGKRR